MTENERLKKAIKFLIVAKKIRNQQEFVERIDSNKTDISLFKNGHKKITNGLFAKIVSSFPCLSYEWLLTGNGNMLNDDDKVSDTILTIPLLPVFAQGGSLNDFIISVKKEDCEMIVSPIKDVDFAMPVNGDSMAPEYPNGSQILVKKINEKAFVEWGKVYVLDTCNGTVIKEVHKGDNDDEVKCVAINPEPKFSPFKIKTADINGWYRVMMCMSLK